MKRLTKKKLGSSYPLKNDASAKIGLFTDYDGFFAFFEAVNRLGTIEDILGDDYDLSRLRKLVEADREGRCVVIPSGGFDDKDGENALKSAMHTVFYHNNPVTRYIADAVSEKLVREAAEEALKERENENGTKI